MKPSLLKTATLIFIFIAVCGALGYGAYWWAESIDPLAGLGLWAWRAILYCFVFALVPWSFICVFAILSGHAEMRERYAEKMPRY